MEKGWWFIGWVTKTMTMADGSPRIQLDSAEEMISTGAYNDFANAHKNKEDGMLLLLVIPLKDGIAKDLLNELKEVAENGRKTGKI